MNFTIERFISVSDHVHLNWYTEWKKNFFLENLLLVFILISNSMVNSYLLFEWIFATKIHYFYDETRWEDNFKMICVLQSCVLFVSTIWYDSMKIMLLASATGNDI